MSTVSPKNINNRYDIMTRILHWSMAIIIIYASVAGYAMHLVVDKNPLLWSFLSTLNMSVATIGTFLFSIRWLWRYFRPDVVEIENINNIQRKISHIMHSFLYFIMFTVFISGFLMIEHSYDLFWLVNIPQPIKNLDINKFFFSIHRVSCIILSISVLIHISAALHHQLIKKNNLLSRM